MKLGWVLNFESLLLSFTSLGLKPQLVQSLSSTEAGELSTTHTAAAQEVTEISCPADVIETLLQSVVTSVRAHAQVYSSQEVQRLAALVCCVALDSNVIEREIRFAIESTLSALLDALSEDSLKASCKSLCQHCNAMTSFHHNFAHLSAIWPPTDRGRFMQRMLAVGFLQKLVDRNEAFNNSTEEIQVTESTLPLA